MRIQEVNNNDVSIVIHTYIHTYTHAHSQVIWVSLLLIDYNI